MKISAAPLLNCRRVVCTTTRWQQIYVLFDSIQSRETQKNK